MAGRLFLEEGYCAGWYFLNGEGIFQRQMQACCISHNYHTFRIRLI